MIKIIKYVIADILRNKIIIAYTALLLASSLSIFGLEDNASKGMASLLNIVLIVVPLVGIIFSSIYIYNSSEFIELLVSRPVKRKTIWLSLYIGLGASLVTAFFVGVGIPVLLFSPNATGIIMLCMGEVLTLVFVSVAMLTAAVVRDRAKGIGTVILLWLYFSLLFDGLVLFLSFQFADYPLEKPMMLVSLLNPIDLARILVVLKMDVSVMMGYTGAVFKEMIGTMFGMLTTAIVLMLWIALPFIISLRKFNRKDL
jgi:Cu-processing system permease protein